MPFNIGIGELLLVLIVALLVFGGRLPEVGRSLGKGLMEFKKGLSGVKEMAEEIAEQTGEDEEEVAEDGEEVESTDADPTRHPSP